VSHPQYTRPLWLGCLAAPWAPILCLVAAAQIRQAQDPRLAVGGLLEGIDIFLLVAVPISYLAMLLAGVPLILWLRASRHLSVFYVCIGAAAIGAALFALLNYLISQHAPSATTVLQGAGLGLSAGITFCIGSGITLRSTRP